MRIFLFDWDELSAARRAAALREAGHEVAVGSLDGARGARAVLARPPDAVVLGLETRPSHSRETAGGIRGCKAGRQIPMVFVGGSPAEIGKTKARIPGAVFARPEELAAVVSSLGGTARA